MSLDSLNQFFRRLALATGTTVVTAFLVVVGIVMAWSPYHEKTVKIVDKKSHVYTATVAHYAQIPAFWLPVLVVVVVALMVIVSHQFSRLWPGVVLGTIVVLAALAFGSRLLPAHFNVEVVLRGLIFMIDAVTAVATVAAGQSLAARRPAEQS